MEEDRDGRAKAVVDETLTALVLVNRILAREDVIDEFGHVSVRHPLRPNHYLISRARSPLLVTKSDIMEFTLDGEQVGSDPRAPYSERHIHGAIYRDRPDVNAVTHHHARPVIPFTMLDVPLLPIFHVAAVIGKNVSKWDSSEEFGDTNMLVDSMDMASSLSRALGANAVVLMRGHGCVCASSSLRAVTLTSIALKENAALILATRNLGDVTYLSNGEIERTAEMLLSEKALGRAWEYWLARAGFAGLSIQ